MKMFQANVGIRSWFSDTKAASLEFQLVKRIAWVEVEGIPFKLWSGNTFNRIANKWGELLDVDNYVNEEDGNEQNPSFFGDDSDEERIPETVFQVDDQGEKNKEEGELVQDVNQSEDPFNLYPLLNKIEKTDTNEITSDGSIKYPPGFSPKEKYDENSLHEGGDNKDMEEPKDRKTALSKNVSSLRSLMKKLGWGLLDEVVKVGMVMGYKMEGCMSNIAEIIEAQGADEVNFLALQETKMNDMHNQCVRACWGNLSFDYVHSEAVGNSGGILCVWDSNSFVKESVTVSDSFVMIRGIWCLTGQNILLIVVYAPQDPREKNILWDYLKCEIGRWKGEVVIMGDFNEVRCKSDRLGSVFNARSAQMFNSFIVDSGLVEINLGGCHYTWCHKSAKKMSKLDRFLVSENLLNTSPHITAVSLDRFLSDHRPILLRERLKEYNAMRYLMGKFKHLKRKFWEWNVLNKAGANRDKAQYIRDLVDIDGIIDCGKGREEDVIKRAEIINKIQKIDELNSKELAQKIKIKWAIEGDENSIKDFRPISLIGSLYKIIAKILANRLVGVLDNIVSEVQSAFIADRQILDGPFILNEVLQWCKTKVKQAMIFKVDFEKAFDSVRWDFLDDVLRKFGFGDTWCKWIQCCLKSSRGSILVNASGLRINMSKSKIMGVHVDSERVNRAAMKLGCLVLKTPFTYLGSIVGGNMSRKQSWIETVDKIKKRLSKWKMNTLSIGGRLTLTKSVFVTQKNTLWTRVIQALHGVNGRIGVASRGGYNSCWTAIIQETNSLLTKGIDVMNHIRIKLGNGDKTMFWEDKWCAGGTLKDKFNRLYALESCKHVTVGTKFSQPLLSSSFRRTPRAAFEKDQFFRKMVDDVKEVILSTSEDRWVWDLENTGEFSVSSIRNLIDEKTLPLTDYKTRWNKLVPIKVNILSWKIMTNSLPTRFNIQCSRHLYRLYFMRKL
ncbi:RNA-directed DNA polymerase, eukaryota, reverse transcriptase zinc-binding domain protein [Tanacetum coccineum]